MKVPAEGAGRELGSGFFLALIFVPWGILGLRRLRTTNGIYHLLILLMALGIFAAVSGCGGGSSTSTGTGTGSSTPSGTYTVTVTGTSGSNAPTAIYSLTVQ
jgi:hypothetical protein